MNILRNNYYAAFLTVTIISLLTSGIGFGSDLPSSSGKINVGFEANDCHGPTMRLSYRRDDFVKNPIASFMYFVPLIAPVSVNNISNVNNDQQVAVISHEITTGSRSFSVICEFKTLGSGFHINTFDPVGMIAAQEEDVKKGRTLTNLLDYVKIQGEGYGQIKIEGRIHDADWTVTKVDVKFNANGHQSPVTIGLYDLEPEDGDYRYENRTNKIVARVNTLVFEKTKENPRMGVKIASISDSEESEGFFSGLKAAIANLFITPPEIDKRGNRTMLEFGKALVEKKPTFTCPKADNINEKEVIQTALLQK